MKKNMKNTYTEIKMIMSDGKEEYISIPTIEYFREQIMRVSMIPKTYFKPNNRISKINNILNGIRHQSS